jgi:hypothetical protein
MPRLPLAGASRCRYMTKVAGPWLLLRLTAYESPGRQRTTKKRPSPRLCFCSQFTIASETDDRLPGRRSGPRALRHLTPEPGAEFGEYQWGPWIPGVFLLFRMSPPPSAGFLRGERGGGCCDAIPRAMRFEGVLFICRASPEGIYDVLALFLG